uniref:Chemosensory protein 10 n=1 Tax=Lissorhoptrus oryzophilus TaxID=308863 RepID=A0A0B4KZD4_9CUCU|nr:chemosensory protein 10 [Lissorhoptrus oryzophilus]
MQIVVLFTFLSGILFSFCLAKPAKSYTNKYDNVNIDEILNSDRLLKNYMNCLLDKGRCTPDGAELKKNLPEALEDDCSKCSEYQRNRGAKALKYLIEHKRSYYDQLERKYDPERKYRKRYEASFKREGINL